VKSRPGLCEAKRGLRIDAADISNAGRGTSCRSPTARCRRTGRSMSSGRRTVHEGRHVRLVDSRSPRHITSLRRNADAVRTGLCLGTSGSRAERYGRACNRHRHLVVDRNVRGQARYSHISSLALLLVLVEHLAGQTEMSSQDRSKEIGSEEEVFFLFSLSFLVFFMSFLLFFLSERDCCCRCGNRVVAKVAYPSLTTNMSIYDERRCRCRRGTIRPARCCRGAET